MTTSDLKQKTEPTRVLVSGATGYVAGWVIKRLLDEGHEVHAAVRDPNNQKKTAHLRELAADSPGTLRFFASDLLEPGSYSEAMEGCKIVFHTASPFVLNPEDAQRDLIKPALQGTINVLEQAKKTPSVQRIVLTSSYLATIGDNADLKDSSKDALTEADWNTTSTLSHQAYAYSKTLAEREAWQIAETQTQWDLVTINPAFVMGPGIHANGTSESFNFVKDFANGELASGIPNIGMVFVDVREVAEAHLQAAFRPEASGRYLVSAHNGSIPDLVEILKAEFGSDKFPFPKRVLPKFMAWTFGPLIDKNITRKYVARNVDHPVKVDASKSINELGVQYRPLTVTMKDMFQQLIDAGIVKPK
jgi:dihydroflavonol-4-reductase